MTKVMRLVEATNRALAEVAADVRLLKGDKFRTEQSLPSLPVHSLEELAELNRLLGDGKMHTKLVRIDTMHESRILNFLVPGSCPGTGTTPSDHF